MDSPKSFPICFSSSESLKLMKPYILFPAMNFATVPKQFFFDRCVALADDEEMALVEDVMQAFVV